MPRYTAFSPENEVPGFAVMSLLTNIQHDEIAPILKKHGLEHVDATRWYRLQGLLDAISDIVAQPNASMNLVSIGMAGAQHGIDQLPPEAKSTPFEAFLMNFPKLYATRIRGGDIGGITVEKLSDSRFRITLRIPFPDDIYYGLLYGYIRHFRPQTKYFSLSYDSTVLRREEGGEKTVLLLELT